MNTFNQYVLSVFLTRRFYLGIIACVVLFILSFFSPALFVFAPIILTGILLLTLADYVILFFARARPSAERILTERLSNGDENVITVRVKNNMPYTVHIEVIDELQVVFSIGCTTFNMRCFLLILNNIKTKRKPAASKTPYHKGD